MRKLILPVIILSAFTATAQNNIPSFINGDIQSLSVCKNSAATSINSLLAVMDLDTAQTETWSVNLSPLHGTLSGFPATATATGDTVIPTGLTYQPASGYSGADTFVIKISDGTDTATTLVAVTVKPLPVLTSPLNPGDICDGSVFSYTPTSSTAGAAFLWNRPFTSGISNPSASGSGNPFETLTNITYYDIPVTYIYTVSANGCSSRSSVMVNVHPTPRLSSKLTDTICSGGTFTYTPASATAGTTFNWSRAAVTGISPVASSGTGGVSETLTNTTSAPVNAVYVYALAANGCTSSRNVVVTVSPASAIPALTTTSPATVCSGTSFQNFGAATPPATGTTYSWSAVNATVYAIGIDKQFALVSFPSSGNAAVILTVNSGAAGCTGTDTFAVHVSSAASASASVIYYNDQLIYLDNTADTYQWGYDLAATLEPFTIPVATFQSYIPSMPDFTNYYYWVRTTKDGCMQKTYYNAPLAVSNVNNMEGKLDIYPNPAGNTITIATNINAGSEKQIIVTDMLGQEVKTYSGVNNTVEMNIAALPAGCYMVNCQENGMRMATSKFIKN
jgi:hypothetical protein